VSPRSPDIPVRSLEWSSDNLRSALSACALVSSIFTGITGAPHLSLQDVDELLIRVSKICQDASEVDAVLAAEVDAGNFSLPSDVFLRDKEELLKLGGLTSLIHARQDLHRRSRFNISSCLECFSEDVEFPVLLSLARSGAVIDTASSFVASHTPDPPRRLLQQLPHTLAKHVFKLWSDGSVLVLPLSDVSLTIPNLHINNLHWCPKPGTPIGRLLGDCSNRETGCSLNSEEAKDLIQARYGTLLHPTIAELVHMIFEVANTAGGLQNVLLWKEDIAGAFGQYNHHAESVPLLAFDIGSGLVMLYLVGMFGWTGSPFVFGVFSRAFQRQCGARIMGKLEVYVDDFMAASPRESAHADQKITQQFVRQACGPKAINVLKSAPPARTAEFIGWFIDLNTGSLRPNDKGIHKLVVSFFGCEIHKPMSLHDYQVLASLACRYSQGLIGLQPFVQPLYAMTCGWHSRHTRRRPSSAAKLAIVVWRTVSLILLIDPSRLAVPLESFIRDPDSWKYFIISDAGPLALGVALYARDAANCLAHVSYTLPYSAIESRFQNVREFHGLLLGEVMLLLLNIRHTNILWRGDNMAALSWARKGSCSSAAAQRAFIAHSWLSLMSGNTVVDAIHQAGTSMGDIDGLSRYRETQFTFETDMASQLHVDDLFRLCDPTGANDSHLDDHFACLQRIIVSLSAHIITF
jgi:hypothetical protein